MTAHQIPNRAALPHSRASEGQVMISDKAIEAAARAICGERYRGVDDLSARYRSFSNDDLRMAREAVAAAIATLNLDGYVIAHNSLVNTAPPPALSLHDDAVKRVYKEAAFKWDSAAQDHNEALRRWVAGNGEGDKPAAPEPLSKNRDDYIISALIAEQNSSEPKES